MFHDIVNPSVTVGNRQAYAVPLSILAHVALVALALVVSVLAPGVLPIPTTALMAFVSQDVIVPPAPPPAPRRQVTSKNPTDDVHPGTIPFEAPSGITPESVVDAAPAPVGTVDGIGNGPPMIGETLVAPPPPPLPRQSDAPLRVGGNVRPPSKIRDVKPLYPAIAQSARVSGVVIIEATIGPTGKVLDTKLLRSIPLLDEAALEAVRQWELTPTLLNGMPVSIVMTVTVNFALN
jgi:protein TonB